MALFEYKIVTPNGKEHLGKAELLTVKTSNGVLGVMKDHTPLEAVIEISELIIHEQSAINYIAVGGGILHIAKEGIVILADSFEFKDEIDLKRAEEAKSRAEERLSGGQNIDVKRAELALKKALNRISVVSK